MLVSARRRQPITHLLGVMLIVSACTKSAPPDDKAKLRNKIQKWRSLTDAQKQKLRERIRERRDR